MEVQRVRCFEGNNVIEIPDGITFNFYMGLPHVFTSTPLL